MSEFAFCFICIKCQQTNSSQINVEGQKHAVEEAIPINEQDDNLEMGDEQITPNTRNALDSFPLSDLKAVSHERMEEHVAIFLEESQNVVRQIDFTVFESPPPTK